VSADGARLALARQPPARAGAQIAPRPRPVSTDRARKSSDSACGRFVVPPFAARLALEAEEERLRQEELARLEEERRQKAEDERERREKEAARRASELGRLASEFEAARTAEHRHTSEVRSIREQQDADRLWRAFLDASDLPPPGSESAVNTFLAEMAEQEQEEREAVRAEDPEERVATIAARTARAEVMARVLEDDAAVAEDEGDSGRAERSRAFCSRLRDDNARRADEATACLLQHRGVWTRAGRDQDEVSAHVSTGQGVSLAVWCNLAGRKAVRTGKMEVQPLGLRVAVSRNVAKEVVDGLPLAIRVTQAPYDHVESAAERAVVFARAWGLPLPPCAEPPEEAAAAESVPAPASAAASPRDADEDDGAPGEREGDAAESKEAEDDAGAAEGEGEGEGQEAEGGAGDEAAAGEAPAADAEQAAEAGKPTAAEGAGAAEAPAEGGAAPPQDGAAVEADGEGDVKAAGEGEGEGDGAADGAAAAEGDAAPAPAEPSGPKTVAEARPAERERTDPADLGGLDEPVSFVVAVELLALPQEARTVKRTSMLRETPLSSAGVMRVPHPMEGGGMSQALTVTVAVPPFVIVPDDIRVGYWHHGSRRWLQEADAPPAFLPDGTRELQFKTTFMTPMALVQPRTVDVPYRAWSLRPINDVRAAVLAARARAAAAGLPAPVLDASAPRPDNGVPVGRAVVSDPSMSVPQASRSVGAAPPLGPAPLGPEDVAAAGGWDDPAADPEDEGSAAAASAAASEGGAETRPTTRRAPLPPRGANGVVITLDTARLRLAIVVGADAAWLVGPCRPELAHLLGVGLRPGVLLARLARSGLRVCPSTQDADVPDVTFPGPAGSKLRLVPKEAVLEAASHRQLARLACGAVVVPSAWNQRVDLREFHAVFRVREAAPDEAALTGVGDAPEDGLRADEAAHPTAWRTVVGASDTDAPAGVRWWLARTQESADEFDPAVIKGSRSAVTVAGALGARITAESSSRSAGAPALLVDAVDCVLRRVRLLSFAV